MRGERAILLAFVASLLAMAAIPPYRHLLLGGAEGWLYSTATCLLCAGAIAIPVQLRHRGSITAPVWFISMIYLALFLHCLGVVEGYYDDIPWWDSITHFLSSMMVAAMAFIALYLIDWYVGSVHIPARLMPAVVVAVGCSFGVLWELMEWTADILLGTGMQYSLEDTMKDLIMDLLGAFSMGLLGWAVLLRHSPGELARELGLEGRLTRLGAWWDRRIRG